MDQQSPSTNPTPAPNPIQMPQTNTVQAQPVVTSGGGSKSKMLIITILLTVVLIALIAGGAYYYLNIQQKSSPAITPAAVTPPTGQVVPSSTPDPEQQLNAISVDNGAADFSAVDKDLQSL